MLPLPFLIALQFLTRIPIRLPRTPTPQELGRSLVWYPLVGLLLGALLYLLGLALTAAPTLLGAALLLTVWVLASGALHLDGLADCADAWVGGHGDRNRMLEIMKDPASGPVAVVAVVLVLLLKFAALAALLESGDVGCLLLVPLLGRTAMPALFLSTPYVRTEGLGAALAAHVPRRAAMLVIIATLLITAGFGLAGFCSLVAAGAAFLLVRNRLLHHLGGTTGDGAGALLELTETAVVIALAAYSPLRAMGIM